MPTLEVIQEGIDVLRYYIQRSEPVPPHLLVEGEIPSTRLLDYRVLEDLILCNYTAAASHVPGKNWKPALIVSRGIVFHRSGQVVSFPYTKFFNVDETPENRWENVIAWPIASITEKMDGVFIQAFRYKGETIWASRHDFFTPPSRCAMKIAGNIRIPEQTTMMFEVISRQFRQPTMIDYGEEEQLWYLGLRYLSNYEIVQAIPPVPLPPTVSVVQMYVCERVDTFLLTIKGRDATKEGVVVQGKEERGNKLAKVKGDAYVQRVRLISGMSPKRVLQIYRQGGMEEIEALDPAILDDREIGKTIRLIIDTERKVWEEVRQVQERGMTPQQIPDPHKRWMASSSPEKYIRAYVARIVEDALRL